MKKVFKFIGYALLSIIGLIAIFLTTVYVKSYFNYKEASKLIGKEAPMISIDGLDFRDLNKNGRLDAYEDYRVNIEDRITNLIGQMSLEEKAGAMFITMAAMKGYGSLSETQSIANPISFVVEGNSAMLLGKHMNHFNTIQSTSPEAMVVWHNHIQKLAERSRLGIPVTLATDPRHGVPNAPGASIYSPFYSSWPSTLGLAATRDSALVRAFGDIARQEYKALGFRLSLSPMADLATEPRWGRINGTFGEDAELAATMTKAYILGFQGDTINENTVECMVKHFSGGGPQEDGRDAHFPPGRQRYKGGNFNYHLIPFVKGAFAAGAAQVMPYYGIPMGQTSENVGFGYNKDIVTGLLRNTYKFEGIVCTDWGLVTDAKVFGYTLKPAAAHGVEKLTAKQRVEKIINAGCDMFGGEALPNLVVELVKEGKISEKRIDSSMRRILKEKFRLGLFDHAYLDPAGVKVINNASFAAKGIEAQQKSLVLLKNDANILPLKAGVKIFLEGFNKEETKGYTNLVNDAASADVIVLKIGTPDNAGPEKYLLQKLFNHGSLAFSEKEEGRLLKIIQSKPTITVINLQRPAVIPGINKYSKALIADFSSQDNVILDLIMGKFKPTGKLPFELASSMEEILKQKEDMPYDTKNPLYKFGAGIGYD
jgi:beta-glucosidase